MAKIQLRRDTAANWAAANPVLALGEPGWDTTNSQLRVGNGTSAWSTLPVYGTGSGAGTNSPAFTGNPTAPTPATSDNDTSLATTAFVRAAITQYAPTGSAVVVQYDGVAWPTVRPTTTQSIFIVSTKFDNVPDPTWALDGDMRIRSAADMEAL